MRYIMLVSNGFEEVEALTVIDLLRRGGVQADICSMTGERMLCGSHEIRVLADCVYESGEEYGISGESVLQYDGVILPGGLPNAHTLRDDVRVMKILRAFAAAGKLTAAICAAPCALEAAGLLDGIEATSYPGHLDESKCIYTEAPSVVSGKVVTSRGVGTAIDFALTLLRESGMPEEARRVASAILYKE